MVAPRDGPVGLELSAACALAGGGGAGGWGGWVAEGVCACRGVRVGK